MAEPVEPPSPDASSAASDPNPVTAATNSALRRAWGERLGAVSVVLLWVLFWYWPSAASMASLWWRSDTFAHGLVVYPIAVWLVWRKRADLVAVDCRISVLGLVGVAVAGLGWLLGEVANVDAARHFGVVLLIACCVWGVLGTAMAKAIAFPLLFTLLAVPVGEFMLPMLIEHTADFTVGALRLTGIPVYREGNNFVVPTGSWSVVEACSGLRYLIASVTLGALYAYLTYRSLLRRGLFFVATIVVPILANWVRAYMIVMIGHLSGMKYAVGVDHLLYGWLFFGIVMLVLFWIGSFWREDLQQTSLSPVSAKATIAPSNASSIVVGAALACIVAVLAPLYATFLDTTTPPSLVAVKQPAPAHGWSASVSRTASYRPHFVGAASELETDYVQADRSVSVYIAYFAGEGQGRELVAHGNGLIDPEEKAMEKLRERVVLVTPSGVEAIETDLRTRSAELTVRHWYWVGGRWVRRPEEVKLRQAMGRLLGRGDDAAVVVISTRSDERSDIGRKALDRFMSDMAPSVDAVLRGVRASARDAAGSSGP